MPTITDTALHIFNRWRILDIHRNNVNGYAVDAGSPGKPPIKDANSMVLAKMQKCKSAWDPISIEEKYCNEIPSTFTRNFVAQGKFCSPSSTTHICR
jgi:hypothetical protein